MHNSGARSEYSTLTSSDKESAQSSFQFEFSRDYVPGTVDINGQYMGGTETTHLIPHAGKLWAGIGYWKDQPGRDPSPGAQVLVKTGSQSDWIVDHSWGPGYVRVDSLASVAFTTDAKGETLRSPKTILLAGVSEASGSRATTVWSRDDATQSWSRMVLTNDSTVSSSEAERPYVRVIQGYVDQVTGVYYVFAGAAKGAIYKGVYDPTVAGQIRWESEPEFYPGRNRIHAMAVANGRLYATVGRDRESDVGGLYERIDGSRPRWQRVYQWPAINSPRYYGGMRGLTAISTAGQSSQLLLGAREQPGVLELIDPSREHKVVETFNYREYFERLWGRLGGAAAIAAYNNITFMKHPDTGENAYLIGLWVNHPDLRASNTALGLSSWYLVRRENNKYEYGRVFDPEHPLPDAPKGLRATRTIVVSPFSEDQGRVLYFGGYDAGGEGRKHNTAWIYRAVVP